MSVQMITSAWIQSRRVRSSVKEMEALAAVSPFDSRELEISGDFFLRTITVSGQEVDFSHQRE